MAGIFDESIEIYHLLSQPFLAAIDADREMAKNTLKFIKELGFEQNGSSIHDDTKIYNLGNSSPIKLNKFIEICEKVTKKNAIYDIISKQQGEVPHTYADISLAKKDLNYNPKVSLEEGLTHTYRWLSSNL